MSTITIAWPKVGEHATTPDRLCEGCRGTGVQLVCGSSDSGVRGHRIEAEPCRLCTRSRVVTR